MRVKVTADSASSHLEPSCVCQPRGAPLKNFSKPVGASWLAGLNFEGDPNLHFSQKLIGHLSYSAISYLTLLVGHCSGLS